MHVAIAVEKLAARRPRSQENKRERTGRLHCDVAVSRELMGDSSLISTISYSSAGSIAVENTNDAGEVACHKPEAEAKGIERDAFENALRFRFRLVSPVPAQSALASAPGLPHGQPQPPKHPSPSSDTTNLGGVRRGLSLMDIDFLQSSNPDQPQRVSWIHAAYKKLLVRNFSP